MPFQRELRRWTRLHPEILTRCQVRIVEALRKIDCELVDLSPGGAGLLVSDKFWHPAGDLAMLEIRFKGQPVVVRAAEIRRCDPQDDGVRLGIAWRMDPPAWNLDDRRNRTRLELPLDSLFARVPLRHAHNVWTRLSVIDVNSDYGFQVETRGGPAYLLPGHLATIHFDLPHIHLLDWDCQVLWIRPSAGQAMRMGLRVLDPDPALEEILSEWLQIRRECSPVQLIDLGFGQDSLQGQYRFRKVEEITESVTVANFLEDLSKRPLRTGMEPLHAFERASDHETIHLGCWDGPQLVAAVTLDTRVDETGDPTHTKVADFAIEPNWLVAEVFMGIWEQTIRLFLASGHTSLWVWCPPGRERLYSLAGLTESSGLALPNGTGTWTKITRDRLVAGVGMNSIRWMILYDSVSSFVLQHQEKTLSWRKRLVRLRKQAIFMILQDWREPLERAKFRREINQWAMEIHDQSNPDS